MARQLLVAQRVAQLVALVPLMAAGSACLFVPDIAQHGYVACDDDTDCEAGRTCAASVCAPPPWHDEEFGDRRVLVVDNVSAAPMPAGTAVPVVIGGDDGLLALDDVKADFRFADFDPATGAWSVRAVHLDRQDDRFTAWIPTAREILQGRSDALAWIESDTLAGLPTVVEDPKATFAAFDAFDAPLSLDAWSVRGEPTVDGGVITVQDNEGLVLLQPFVPPVQATVVARIDGVSCEDVTVGFTSRDDAAFAFPEAPAAGLFVDEGLAAAAQVGPVAGGQLELRGNLAADNAQARITVGVHDAGVRVLWNDEVVVDERGLRPPFPAEPLFFMVQVGGACSIDVDAMWITPLPLPPPVVTPGPAVELKL